MAKSPAEMEASMVASLDEKTGRPLAAWVKVVSASGLQKHGEIVKMLKDQHGVTHGYANLIAHKALKSDAGSAGSEDELIEAQYAGDKAALRDIYERLIAGIAGFGEDIEIAPKKAYVSLRRKKQFAIIQPSTKTRVDVGLNLKDVKPVGRLEASGSFNSMVSHRVRLESADQVDAELLGWLREAYTKS
ncbi:MAG: DUF4287 domain-containing protein [Phycisphaerales bacterium JB039]